MNGGLNVEICDSDLNCCNAGSLDSDRDDFNKGIKLASAFGIIDYDHPII